MLTESGSGLRRAAVLACGFTFVAALAVSGLPAHAYTTGFAPHWVTVAAAAGGALYAIRPAPRVLGWVAALLLLWSASGIVLDGFRAFFAITGIPAGEFARVDWPGLVKRAFALAATALVGALVLRDLRLPDGRRLGYLAFALGFVYPTAKLYWSYGGTLLRPDGYAQGFPYAEVILCVIGAAGSLALAQEWGRRLPRGLVLLGGWTGAAMLTTMGSMSVFGTLSQLAGLTDGPVPLHDAAAVVMVGAVYGSWLLFGLCVGGATLAYQRRPHGGRSSRGPVDRRRSWTAADGERTA
ncbi:hypothetical protein HII36_53065 [Nonomuraea sp. NN258]|uniref:hypothetical protein n=1 Tax=Nonomuraea antri TaxID=2730852 RepID=UPI001569BC24|nr:hypothetical protein [Nonomuraea antri]NRQ40495.1 hypothetical protein [Nonomuraea antri]